MLSNALVFLPKQRHTSNHWNNGRTVPALSISLDYCLLPSPLLRVSSAAVDGLTFIMKYPLPSSKITDTCVLLMGGPQVSVTVQSWATEYVPVNSRGPIFVPGLLIKSFPVRAPFPSKT